MNGNWRVTCVRRDAQQCCELAKGPMFTFARRHILVLREGRLIRVPQVPLHKQLALPALHAKKSVFVEWALGSSLQEAEELAALAKKQGVKTAIGLQARLLPSVQKAKQIIDSGALGRITGTTVAVSSSMLLKFPEKYSYLNDPQSGTDPVSIMTIHTLDPLCYLLGEFKSFNATTATAFPELRFIQANGSKGEPVKSTLADFISISGVLESGVPASSVLTSTTVEATRERLEWIISGEKGSLKFEGGPFIAMSPHRLFQYAQPEQEAQVREDKERFVAEEGAEKGAEWKEVEVEKVAFGGIGQVYRAFAEGSPDLVDFETAVKRHKMIDAIFRSAKSGTRESY